MSVAAVLSGLRSQKGWTQEELAEKSGVSVRTIRNLESGRVHNPRRASVDLLITALEAGDGRAPAPVTARRIRLHEATPTRLKRVDQIGEARWTGPRPPLNSFVGRDRKLTHLLNTVMSHRITVLTGPGGVGKTRLSMVLAEVLQTHLVKDVFVIELGRLPAECQQPPTDVGRLLHAADVLAEGALIPHLEELASLPDDPGVQTLILLDNAEHLPRATAMLAEHLVQRYWGTRVVVTSRRVVPAPSAQVHEVPPICAEETLDLLVDRARSHWPALDLSGNPAAVRALCHKLEGMPRAIEFAAEKLRTVPADKLLTEVFVPHALKSSPPFALPHQRSLASSARWSLELLDDRNRAMLRVLARMPSSFTIEDVERALADKGFTRIEVVDRLVELVESSLVFVEYGPEYTYQVISQVGAFVHDDPAAEIPRNDRGDAQ